MGLSDNMIHPSATIDSTARIDSDVEIGANAYIGPNVAIGQGTKIYPNAVILQNTTMGKNNQVHSFAVLGGDPQDTGYKGEPTFLEIGDNNIFREGSTVNRATVKADGITRIGNNNYLMSYAHIAHDCQVGNNNVMVNYSCLAGHVLLENNVTISAYCAVHQFSRVGSYSFLVHGALVEKDILPYVVASSRNKSTATIHGLNIRGLKRNGFSKEAIHGLRDAYKVLFMQNLPIDEALSILTEMQKNCPEIKVWLDFMAASQRGFVR
ncbi:MAG: acyl-ACP--UDP-N-acetylglucosamine O-acyltransferase [Gammaproteobacteria bacterium]|nr:acyl-ACP--UDP-N-acetylglucosamine O-acyltransferase [Gammaproteobacteria bacterium]